MRLRLQAIFAALVISLNCLYPQEQLPGHITSLLEDIAGLAADDIEAADYAEELVMLAEDPVRINSDDANGLKRLFFLTGFQLRSIIDYRSRHGGILSAMELSYLPGFDTELAELVSAFAVFDAPMKEKTGSGARHMRFMLNYIQQDDKNGAKYTGSPAKILSKARYSSGPLTAYLTMDKDRGEPLLLPGMTPDFVSASLAYRTGTVIDKIIVGDFKVRFGQGLAACNGFSRPPVPTETRLMKGNSDIIPYSSSAESDFFRGAAVSISSPGININAYASLNMIDATTTRDENTGAKYISSFYSSGLHNTTNTLMKRKQVSEKSAGININGMYKNLYCGFSLVHSDFSLPVGPPEHPRDIYDFSGKKNTTLSVDYAYLFKDSYLFGEFSLHNENKTAFIQGISLNPEGRVRFNLLYSRVNRGFNAFHGKAAGMSTFNRPRRNIISGISCELSRSLSLAAGVTDRKELWYNNTSGGFPRSMLYMLSLSYRPAESLSLSADIKHRSSDRWVNPLQGVKTRMPMEKTNLRLSAEILLTEHFKIRTRLEQVAIADSRDRGFMCYQSASYSFRRLPLEIRARLAVFQTGSYDSRLFAWEDDLLYNPLVKALYGEGSRSYILVSYKIAGKVNARFKYAVSRLAASYDGYDTYEEFKFQLYFSF